MPLATNVEATCPRCNDDTDVWMFRKPEGSVTKECYTCYSCGCEWTEIIEKESE